MEAVRTCCYLASSSSVTFDVIFPDVCCSLLLCTQGLGGCCSFVAKEVLRGEVLVEGVLGPISGQEAESLPKIWGLEFASSCFWEQCQWLLSQKKKSFANVQLSGYFAAIVRAHLQRAFQQPPQSCRRRWMKLHETHCRVPAGGSWACEASEVHVVHVLLAQKFHNAAYCHVAHS